MPIPRKPLGLLAWLFIIFLCELFLLAAMLPMNLLQNAGAKEFELSRKFLGEESANILKVRTDNFYDTAFNQTGMVKESFRLFIPTKSDQQQSRGLEKMGSNVFLYIEERLIAFWTAVYLAVHRIMSLLVWIPGFIPILVAAGYDGFCKRKIRFLTFATSSASAYGTGRTTIYALLIGLIILAMFPFPVPPIIAPLWAGAMVVSVSLMIANWPRT
jgi:hypothetical protein